MRSNNRLAPALIIGCIASISLGCGQSQSSFPDPYAGYTHSRPEHGYWREIPEEGRKTDDPTLLEELHFHDSGFSVTYQPFETYKDYWGSYEWNRADGTIELRITEANSTKPAVFDGVGEARLVNEGTFEVSDVALAGERGAKTYRFERYFPRQ